MGAWISYALGSEAEDLPAFVAIPDPRGVPQVGPGNWSAGFLPAVFQGTALGADRSQPHGLTATGAPRVTTNTMNLGAPAEAFKEDSGP